MPSAYSATTRDNLLLDGGRIYIANAVFSVTRGSVRVDYGEETRQVAFDGQRAPIAGLDRIVTRAPTITARFLELSAAKLAQLKPGSTSGTVGGITTVTPPDAGDFLTPLTNVRAVFDTGAGGLYEVRFARAWPVMRGLEGEDNGEASYEVTFAARLNWDGTTVTTDSAPYTEHFYTSGTALATL